METPEFHDVVVQVWHCLAKCGSTYHSYTLHLTEKDKDTFIKDHWSQVLCIDTEDVARPHGDSYVSPINEEVFARITASKNGIREYHRLDAYMF